MEVPQPRKFKKTMKQIKILKYSIAECGLKNMEIEINNLLCDGWKIEKRYLINNETADMQTNFIIWLSRKEYI